MKLETKRLLRQKRRWRIRRKVRGRADRPRLAVHFSGKHIYAQCIDDDAGRTLVYASSLAKDWDGGKVAATLAGAEKVGRIFGEKAKSAGVDAVVFDRGGRPYHGRVKVFADAAREAGLKF